LAETSPSDPVPELRSAGQLLYAALFPADQSYVGDLVARLRALDEPLLIRSDESTIPWELLHDEEQFFALRYDLGRQSVVASRIFRSPQTREISRVLLIADPLGDLPQAREETMQLLEWFERRGARCTVLAQSQANLQGVLLEMKNGAYDLLHYSGHVVIDPRSQEAALVLDSEQRLDERTIRGVLRGAVPAVIFVNGCASAHHVSSVCSAFMIAGSQLVVGTLYRVSEQTARQFAELFYDRILAGTPAGRAIRESRELLGTRPDATWASFVLYGDPTFCIQWRERAEPARGGYEAASPFDPWEERCDEEAVAMLQRAAELALPIGVVTSVHLLVAQLGTEGSPIRESLARHDMDPVALHTELTALLNTVTDGGPKAILTMSPTVARTLDVAQARATNDGREQIAVDDISWGFAEVRGGMAGEVLERLGVPLTMLLPRDAQPVGAEEALAIERVGPFSSTDCTPDAWKALSYAVDAVRRSGSAIAGTPHLFVGMLHVDRGPLASALRRLGINPSQLGQALGFRGESRLTQTSDNVGGNVDCSQNLKKILLLAQTIAVAVKREKVTDDDLLVAFVQQGGGETGKLLRQIGVVVEALISELFLDSGELDTSRFDQQAQRVVEKALECARQKRHGLLGRRHLLYAMLLAGNGELPKRLREQSKDAEQLADLLYVSMRAGPSVGHQVKLKAAQMSADLVKILCAAEADAQGTQEGLVAEARLLRALLIDGGGEAGQFLVTSGVRWTGLMWAGE